MRNRIAIFLLVCFCLHYVGFSLFYLSVSSRVKTEWESKIWEGEIDISSADSLKIPLSLPYMANQEDFQTTNFSMEKDGEYIRVIKQRYQNDSLEVVFVPDTEKQVLNAQMSDWIKSLTDSSSQSNQERNRLFLKFYPKNFIANKLTKVRFAPAGKLQSTINYLKPNYSDFIANISPPPPELG